MSPLAFFTMSKAKTLAWTLFCVGLAILFAYMNLGICSGAALIWAGFLGCIAAYKFIRDRGIISRARIEGERAPKAITPPMTSQGSDHLFVPPSIDRR